MRRFKHRRAEVGAALTSAAIIALFALPASPASAVTFNNACTTSLIPTLAGPVPVTMTATSPASVSPGGSVTLSNINQLMAVPSAAFVAGYNLGLLTTGTNMIPITDIQTKIEGTNTVEGTQFTNNATTTATTFITDPDGVPGTGDETATPGSLSVTYNDQTWTAGASGTIDFREDTVMPLGVDNGGIVINALVAGIIAVQFRCSPGQVVEGADPSTITFDDPAASFASTNTTVAPPPLNKCTSKKLLLAGKKTLAKTKCHAKGVGKGIPTDPPCLTKAETKFSDGWAKEEAKGGCLTTSDVMSVEAAVDLFIDGVVTDLVNAPTASKCTSKKLGLAGKKALARAKCHSKAVGKGIAVDAECLQKASVKFADSWSKAEKSLDCQAGTGDAATIESKVDVLVDELVGALVP